MAMYQGKKKYPKGEIDLEACIDNNNTNNDDISNKSLDERLCVICLDKIIRNGSILGLSDADASNLALPEEGGILVSKRNNNNNGSIVNERGTNGVDKDNTCTLFSPDDDTLMTIQNQRPDMAIPVIQGWKCNHLYHRVCILPWFEQGKLSCPCCRRDLLNPSDFRNAVLSVLRKERLQMMHRWGVGEGWTSSVRYNE